MSTSYLTKKKERRCRGGFKRIKDLNIKSKMIKLFANNIEDYLYTFEIGNDFLREIKHNT